MDQRVETKDAAGAGASGAQAVERTFRLLSIVGRGGASGVGLGEAVADSGLNKPTVRRLLLALIRAGMVLQDGTTRRYHLGPELYVLGHIASSRYGLLEVAGESLRRLAALTGDTVFLTMRRDDYAVCMHREEGAHPIRTHALQAGDQFPLGIGAGSLAMLASLPDAEIELIFSRVEPVIAARFPACPVSILREDIAQTRATGIAFNPGRVLVSSWGIGRIVRFPDGRLAGALSIAAIDSRLGETRRAEIGALLRQEAAHVEARLQRLFQSQENRARSSASYPRIARAT